MKYQLWLYTFALAACGGGKGLDKDKMSKMKSDICACTTKDCVDKINADNRDFAKALDEKLQGGKVSGEDAMFVVNIGMEIAACERKLAGDKSEKKEATAETPKKDPTRDAAIPEAAAIKKKLQGAWKLEAPNMRSAELKVEGDKATLTLLADGPGVPAEEHEGDFVVLTPNKFAIANTGRDLDDEYTYWEDAKGELHVQARGSYAPRRIADRNSFAIDELKFADGKCTDAGQPVECGFKKDGDVETFFYVPSTGITMTSYIYGDLWVPEDLVKGHITKK